MTDEALRMKRKIFSTQAPSRKLILQYLRAITAEAKQLPIAERDELAAEIMQPFIELSHPPEDADLDYIVFQLVGGILDVLPEDVIHMSKPEDQSSKRKRKELTWHEVIARIEQLSQ